jgi:mannose-6-phosphate isomerase-like protein (cupin superfamily)
MAKTELETVEGGNFTAAHVGPWERLDEYVFTDSKLPGEYPGKLFLKKELRLTALEVSLNKLAPGGAIPFYHKHQANEELYVFIGGEGQFQIDGEIIDVREGTVIRVAPEGERAWRNNSTEDLYFVVIQAKAGSFEGETISDGKGVQRTIMWPQEEND